MTLKFYAIDTETTGVNVNTQELIEFSIIDIASRTQCTRIVKAETPWTASDDALRITGRVKSDLSKGMPKEQAVQDFIKFIEQDGLTTEHRVIIAHNAPFDRRFLHALFRKCNQTKFPATAWIDTMAVARDFLKKKGLSKTADGKKQSVKLDECIKFAGLEMPDVKVHSAAGDSQTLYLFWNKMIEEGIDYLPFIKRFPYGGSDGEESSSNDSY